MAEISRPITKKRVKIGLSIDGKANSLFKDREDTIHKRMLDYKNNEKDALLDFDELYKNKEALEKEKQNIHIKRGYYEK